MIPQQDVIYLDLTQEDVENPSAELKQKVLDFYKKGTILWVVLRVTDESVIELFPFTAGFYQSDDIWTFYFGADNGTRIENGQQ